MQIFRKENQNIKCPYCGRTKSYDSKTKSYVCKNKKCENSTYNRVTRRDK